MQLDLVFTLQPPNRSFYNHNTVSNMRPVPRWTGQSPRLQGDSAFRSVLVSVQTDRFRTQKCSTTAHCVPKAATQPSTRPVLLPDAAPPSSLPSDRPPPRRRTLSTPHRRRVSGSKKTKTCRKEMMVVPDPCLCSTADNIGTQTVGGRTDGPAGTRSGQYKYSSAVRNPPHVITVHAPVPRPQVTRQLCHVST